MSQEILNKFLTEMGELLKSAKDFTVEQAPQVAREILKYNLAVDVLWTVLPLIGLIALTVIVRKVHKEISSGSWDDFVYAPLAVIGTFAGLGLGASFVYHVSDALKITLAPRLYLIEYFAALVKGVGK